MSLSAMHPVSGYSTRASLLLRIQEDPNDQRAWGEFVDRFGPLIHQWCRSWKLQESDAQDVTQTVLLKLARGLPDFKYDPARSFRGWLRTVTLRSWSDFVDAERRGVRGSADSGVHVMLHTVEARDDLLNRLQQGFDEERMEFAMEQVRSRVQPQTWDAFQKTAVEGVSAQDVARQLGMSVATVYRARSVVQAMLRDTIAELESVEDQTCPSV